MTRVGARVGGRPLRVGATAATLVAVTAGVVLLAGCARGGRNDADCEQAARALADAGYRATLKAAVERQFDAGEFGPAGKFSVPDDMPGALAVKLAPEFTAIASRPLQERLIVDARGDIDAVFVGWPPGQGVLVDVRPHTRIPVTKDYGDGVALVCEARD
ncbi:hypothetical protein [Lysobacter xanthus]